MRPENDVKTSAPPGKSTLWQNGLFVPGFAVAALLAYKGHASLTAIQRVWSSGNLLARSDVVALGGAAGLVSAGERSLSYFVVIWPALAFGVLIGAAVRAFVPKDWSARILSGRTLRAQLTAGATGAPLMLCSCCVAPVFSAVYERSSRLGPSLAIMLASPSLNPAALILTAMLFAPKIAIARVLMAAGTVYLGGLVVERLFAGASSSALNRSLGDQEMTFRRPNAALGFLRSLAHIVLRTVPVLILGVVCSTLLTQCTPKELFSSIGLGSLAVVATASIAVPLALPTFFEIPLALALMTAGAPVGAAAALLFAGPAINLPSLLTLAKSTNWKVAAGLAGFIWLVAVAGGLLLSV